MCCEERLRPGGFARLILADALEAVERTAAQEQVCTVSWVWQWLVRQDHWPRRR